MNGKELFRLADERYADIIDLVYGLSLGDSDYELAEEIFDKLEEGDPLKVVGRGGDMVAFSRPDLPFIVKFPYDDSLGIRQRWSERIQNGFFLAKHYLGGIVAPTIDIPILLQGSNNREYPAVVIVQQKVMIIGEQIRVLTAEGDLDKVQTIRNEFFELNQKMWERGVLDGDPSWEDNYGLTPEGKLVLIDIGDLSDRATDFYRYEGLPRKTLYGTSLRDFFSSSNFR